jgi:hypothetical protein
MPAAVDRRHARSRTGWREAQGITALADVDVALQLGDDNPCSRVATAPNMRRTLRLPL